MTSPREEALLIRAATLYYLDGKSQAEVAAEIGASRSNVSRLLTTARKTGIVDIRINAPLGRATNLELALSDKYDLTDCRVALSGAPEMQLTQVGALGAQWLQDNLPHEGTISLSWGASVQAVVDEMATDPTHSSLEVLPLVGGLSIVDSARDGNVLVRALATKLGARNRRLYAPAVVESAQSRKAFLTEPSISSVLADSAQSQIAIVGIGSVGKGASSTILESMKLTDAEREKFDACGAVGDCCTRYFDSHGRQVSSAVNDHVVAIDLAELKNIPTVVGVAAGKHKAAGVRGALMGRLINVLIVDSELATELLALD